MHKDVAICYTTLANPCILMEKNNTNPPKPNTIPPPKKNKPTNKQNPKPHPKQKPQTPMGSYKFSWREQLFYVPISRIM